MILLSVFRSEKIHPIPLLKNCELLIELYLLLFPNLIQYDWLLYEIELFMDAFHISTMFRFVSKGSNLVIVLDIIKLDKHPIYYLVDLLSKINDNLNHSLDEKK